MHNRLTLFNSGIGKNAQGFGKVAGYSVVCCHAGKGGTASQPYCRSVLLAKMIDPAEQATALYIAFDTHFYEEVWFSMTFCPK